MSDLVVNPAAVVRVSEKRLRRPDILNAHELRTLLAALPGRERLLAVICTTTGMWIREALGLKWKPIFSLNFIQTSSDQ